MPQTICQSCGMPMKEEMYGTNADGSANAEYCKYCFENGAFHNPGETMEQMIETCVPFMVQEGIAEQDARAQLKAGLPRLKRWQ